MDIQRRDSDGLIVQFGNGLGARAAHTILSLAPTEEQAFRDLYDQPNGGIVMALPARTFSANPAPAPDPEIAIVGDILARLSSVKPTASLGAGLSTDLQTCRDYLALNSPSNAQRLAMEKALIRILASVIRTVS